MKAFAAALFIMSVSTVCLLHVVGVDLLRFAHHAS
jgi:hypothetical protein